MASLERKPSARSSIGRFFSSKVLADVIHNKEGAAKKAKEQSSRRLSGAITTTKAATVSHGPRASMSDVRLPGPFTRKEETPDKTITRRRTSALQRALLADEKPGADLASPEMGGMPLTRTTSLRPRKVGNSVSSLPKYRPRSVVIDSKRVPSPMRPVAQKQLNSSEDERPTNAQAMTAELASAAQSSPRAKDKVKGKTGHVSGSKGSPARTAKIAKGHVPRPSSSSSSSSSFITPGTPKHGAVKSKGPAPSPLGAFGIVKVDLAPESPLSTYSRKAAVLATEAAGNMSHISEGADEDSIDAGDVAILLAPVASLNAETPAMPRIQTSRSRPKTAPQTPTRSNVLPTRANLSYLSPMPPDTDKKDGSPNSLRPSKTSTGSERAAPRGSILSWEQLASDASMTLGEEEIGSMLADIPAPFRSGNVSPSPTHLDVPESPFQGEMPSPSGYGSISQVLLPDVTPSPAMHNSTSRYQEEERPAVDPAIVTLLRLQLASADNTAKERLYQLQSIEEEMHDLKQSHRSDVEYLSTKVLQMEEHFRSAMETRQKMDDERSLHLAALEQQLQDTRASQELAVAEASATAEKSAQLAKQNQMDEEKRKWNAAALAQAAATQWTVIHELALSELDMIKSNKEMLSVLLAELDCTRRKLIS